MKLTSRKRVLAHLLPREKLADGQVDRRVKPRATLVRPKRRVELHPIPVIDLDCVHVVLPRYPELDRALRHNDDVHCGPVLRSESQ